MRVFFAFLVCLFVIVPATASTQNFPGEDQPSQGGGQPSGPVCGNGKCEKGENKKNCKDDCNWKKNDGKCEKKKGERKKSSPKDCGGGSGGGKGGATTSTSTGNVDPALESRVQNLEINTIPKLRKELMDTIAAAGSSIVLWILLILSLIANAVTFMLIVWLKWQINKLFRAFGGLGANLEED